MCSLWCMLHRQILLTRFGEIQPYFCVTTHIRGVRLRFLVLYSRIETRNRVEFDAASSTENLVRHSIGRAVPNVIVASLNQDSSTLRNCNVSL